MNLEQLIESQRANQAMMKQVIENEKLISEMLAGKLGSQAQVIDVLKEVVVEAKTESKAEEQLEIEVPEDVATEDPKEAKEISNAMSEIESVLQTNADTLNKADHLNVEMSKMIDEGGKFSDEVLRHIFKTDRKRFEKIGNDYLSVNVKLEGFSNLLAESKTTLETMLDKKDLVTSESSGVGRELKQRVEMVFEDIKKRIDAITTLSSSISENIAGAKVLINNLTDIAVLCEEEPDNSIDAELEELLADIEP